MSFPPDFDLDASSTDPSRLFGLPIAPESCAVQVIPVPWEATAREGQGTRHGPDAIHQASHQIGLYDPEWGDIWRSGVGMLPPPPGTLAGGETPEQIDALAEQIHQDTYMRGRVLLDQGRIPAILGGDHSSPLGLIRAAAEAYPRLGILHIDAHLALRESVRDLRYAPMTIFHHVLKIPEVGRVVGVGYRDMGRAEAQRARKEPRHHAFHDHEIQQRLAEGAPWSRICEGIVAILPPVVYVSFGIDGLEPSLCPGAGAPVPGGLSWGQAMILLKTLSARRRVIGFDLCEVAPIEGSDWDARVGARVLYRLAGCALRSGSAPTG